MDHLSKIDGRLFGAKRKVKLLAMSLLIFSAPSWAEPAQPYGPYVVEQAALWLPYYLEAALLDRFGFIKSSSGDSYQYTDPKRRRMIDLFENLQALSSQFRWDNFKNEYYARKDSPFLWNRIKRGPRIQFRKGGDKVFNLENKPPRMAVTGTALDSNVIFNLGLISDPRKFSFADALALWMHELGHKITDASYTQDEIDTAAGMMAHWYADQMHIYQAGGIEVLILNPVPYLKEGERMFGPFSGTPQRRSSVVAVLEGDNFTNLAETLNSELDRFLHPQSNYLEVLRAVTSVVKLKENPSDVELRLEIRTSRLPKNQNFYVADEIGPDYYKSVRIQLSRNLKSLTATYYVNEPIPRPLIMDAEAEFTSPHISLDKKTLNFNYQLHLKNQTHFHAAGYPSSRFTLMVLVDGEPMRLEAVATYRVTDQTAGMPHEVYMKPFTKEAAVTVDISQLRGNELTIVGMQDRFSTLGTGYEGHEQEQKRVHVRESLSVSLTGCELSLRP